MTNEGYSRREFVKKGLATAAGLTAASFAARAGTSAGRGAMDGSPGREGGDTLYNGIRLPEVWPPRNIDPASREPMPVPYLDKVPDVIPIDVGRQLFVDDFLIAQTDLRRRFHKARKFEGNPVLKPETDVEKQRNLPVATPKDGGVWWDPADRKFKMWYEAGWLGDMAYATSDDGIHWERPDLGVVRGTNVLIPPLRPDSTTVFLDHDTTDPSQRYKMLIRGPGGGLTFGFSLVSPDGIEWHSPIPTGPLGDRSTMFYNPFRKKWVYSVRSSGRLRSPHGRARFYREHAGFLEGAKWSDDDLVFWTGADDLDPPDPEIGAAAQLYNLSAVGYESLMLGFYQIHRGPPNSVCMEEGIPKLTELNLAYSRDGFHWHRPDRRTFIESTRNPGDWDRGYVQSVGGICLVMGDELWFYYTGFSGDPDNNNPAWMLNGMYANGSTGIAKLRRDGFASMDAGSRGGTLTTRPVTFDGRHLFVNVDCPGGEFRAEVLDEAGDVIAPFRAENCQAVSVDGTRVAVRWKEEADLSELRGRPVRFRFHLENGALYSFWVSPDDSGASHGYVAAGGPGFDGARDTVGNKV